MFNSRLIPSTGFVVYEMTEQLFSPISVVSQTLHTHISLSTAEDLKTPQVMSPFNKAYLCSSLCCPPVNLPTYSPLLVSCHKANTNVHKQTPRAVLQYSCDLLYLIQSTHKADPLLQATRLLTPFSVF